jgi:hypothetical protein
VFHQRGRDGGSIFFFFLFLEHWRWWSDGGRMIFREPSNFVELYIYILYIYYAPGCILCGECTQASQHASCGQPAQLINLAHTKHTPRHAYSKWPSTSYPFRSHHHGLFILSTSPNLSWALHRRRSIFSSVARRARTQAWWGAAYPAGSFGARLRWARPAVSGDAQHPGKFSNGAVYVYCDARIFISLPPISHATAAARTPPDRLAGICYPCRTTQS